MNFNRNMGNTPFQNRKRASESTGNGNGNVITSKTLDELQSRFPNGTSQPVWVSSENSWYYWDGEIVPPTDTTPPVVTVTPSGGIYTSTQTVTLSSETGATIYYSIDGSNPTVVYSSPISISTTKTLKYYAVDAAGNNSSVQTTAYTIDLTVPDTTAPEPITVLVIGTPTSNSIAISWTLSASPDVSKYEVAYSTDGNSFTVASAAISSSTNTYTITGLTSNTSYTIRVVAIDNAGNRSIEVVEQASTTTIPDDIVEDIIIDSFDRTNSTTDLGTSDSGHSWQPLNGVWGVENNSAYLVSKTDTSLALVDVEDVLSENFTLSTDIKFGIEGGIAFRVVDSSNYILCRLFEGKVQLYTFVANTASVLIEEQEVNLILGNVYNLKVDQIGSNIRCYLDNVLVIEAAIFVQADATKFGYRQSSISNDRYDNFKLGTTTIPFNEYVAYDTFNRAIEPLKTPDKGLDWEIISGNWSIQNNKVLVDNSSSESIAVIDSKVSDVEISVSMSKGVSSMVFRMSDSSNYYIFRVFTNKYDLIKFVNGTATVISSIADSNPVNTAFLSKVVLKDDTIQCFSNGKLIFTVKDSFNMLATKHGLRESTSSNQGLFDNFSIKSV